MDEWRSISFCGYGDSMQITLSSSQNNHQANNMRVYKGFDWDTKLLPFIYLEMGYFALLVLYSSSSFSNVSACAIILCLLFKLCNSIQRVYVYKVVMLTTLNKANHYKDWEDAITVITFAPYKGSIHHK